MSLVLTHTKKIIQSALLKFAEDEKSTANHYQLIIYTDNEDATPCYKKLKDFVPEKKIDFLDFAPKNISVFGVPFEIETKVPPYLKDGLIRFSKQYGCNVKDIKVVIYTTDIDAKDLHMFLELRKGINIEELIS